jgi:hypothetical protein
VGSSFGFPRILTQHLSMPRAPGPAVRGLRERKIPGEGWFAHVARVCGMKRQFRKDGRKKFSRREIKRTQALLALCMLATTAMLFVGGGRGGWNALFNRPVCERTVSSYCSLNGTWYTCASPGALLRANSLGGEAFQRAHFHCLPKSDSGAHCPWGKVFCTAWDWRQEHNHFMQIRAPRRASIDTSFETAHGIPAFAQDCGSFGGGLSGFSAWGGFCVKEQFVYTCQLLSDGRLLEDQSAPAPNEHCLG